MALNGPFDEIVAPLASQENFNEDMKYSEHLSAQIYCDDDVDIKKCLLKNFQQANKCSVIIQQPNITHSQATDKNGYLGNGIAKKENIDDTQKLIGDQRRKEISKIGSVDFNLYWRYVRAGSSIFGITILILSTLMSHGLFRFMDSWLSVWTSNERLYQMNNLTSSYDEHTDDEKPPIEGNRRMQEFNKINHFYLIVFCSSVVGLIFFCYVMIIRFFLMCISASRNLHNQMFSR